MLTHLFRVARARLFPPPRQTATYSCDRCGLHVKITDHPDRVTKILDTVISHGCKPKPTTL